MYQLASPKLTITIADIGGLLTGENHLAGEAYHLAADTFALETDQGRFSNQATPPVRVTQTQDRLVYHFAFEQLSLELTYRLSAENGFMRRSVKIANRTPLRLLKLTLGQTVFRQPADEVIHYLTLPFIRSGRSGPKRTWPTSPIPNPLANRCNRVALTATPASRAITVLSFSLTATRARR